MILNTRNINPNSINTTIVGADPSSNFFQASPLNPRLLFVKGAESTDTTFRDNFTTLGKAEGIWIIPVKSEMTTDHKDPDGSYSAEFYDFHIYTCWFAPDRERPTTIGTIMRLYNPEMFEVGK